MPNGREIFFGNTVRASIELITNRISPLNTGDTIVINGSFESDDIKLTSSETIVGVNAGDSPNGSNNTFIGADTGSNITTGASNTLVGRGAGTDITTGDFNTYVGTNAGTNDATGASNTYVGTFAGLLSNGATNNTLVGTSAGNLLTTQSGNTYIGQSTGRQCLGLSNTAVGRAAAYNNAGSTASYNVNVGELSGYGLSTGADSNIMIGYRSGYSTTTGDSNVFIGRNSGDGITTGTNNVVIGTDTNSLATTLSNCVLIGYTAGESNTVDNRLIIENTNDLTTPLIDGDFAGNNLTINGTVQLGATTDATSIHTINGDIATGGGGGAVPANYAKRLRVQINGSYYYIWLETAPAPPP